MLLKVSELSRGQKLWLERRRKGQTQKQAAKRHKVKLPVYREWEADKEKGPVVKVGKLADHEQCVLKRRTEELTAASVAEDLGCCRYWLHRMEKGEVPATKLLEYWAA